MEQLFLVTVWQVVAYFFIPLAVTLLTLIVIGARFPRNIRKQLYHFVENVLTMKVLGVFDLLLALRLVTAVSLAATANKYYQIRQQTMTSTSPLLKAEFLANRFHVERDLCVSVLAFLSWYFVGRAYFLGMKRLDLEDEIAELKAERNGGVPDPVPTEPNASPQPEHSHAEKKGL